MNIRVVVDHRSGADTFKFFQIEVLNVLGSQSFQGDPFFSEIGADDLLYHVAIGSIDWYSDGSLHDFKPLFHEISEKHIVCGWRILNEFTPLLLQNCLRSLFIALDRQASRNPFCLPVSENICVVKYRVEISFLFSYMSCYHYVLLSRRAALVVDRDHYTSFDLRGTRMPP
jgi:hypothetical protein